jgi:hypothetical protein
MFSGLEYGVDNGLTIRLAFGPSMIHDRLAYSKGVFSRWKDMTS